MKKLIIASTSTLYGQDFLEYLLPTLQTHFEKATTITFIPYARPSGITHDEYTQKTAQTFAQINKEVVGIHTFENPTEAIQSAEAIFIGGGNTFLLTKQLYQNNLITPLKQAIEQGTPYLGCSAGSNITGLTIETTNDMPIIYPPSFKALSILPFNINPHYLDPVEGLEHMGETRETRIKEFHQFNTQPVLGLREGSWLLVEGENITLKGKHSARLFMQNQPPTELAPESDLSNIK